MISFFALFIVKAVHGLWLGLAVGLPLMRLGLTLCETKLPFDRSWAGLHVFMMSFALVQYALDWPCPLTQAEQWLTGTSHGTFMVPVMGPVSTVVILGAVFFWLIVGLMGPSLLKRFSDRMAL